MALPHTPRSAPGVLAALAAALAASSAPAAQPLFSECAGRLTDARVRYVAQRYAEVEGLVGECLQARALPDEGMTEGYRMLALSFLRQDLLAEAQAAVVKHLAWSFAYEPDEVADPPLYVALVQVIRQQLTVPAGAIPAPPEPVAGGGERAPTPGAGRQSDVGLVHAARLGASNDGPFRFANAVADAPGGLIPADLPEGRSWPGGVTEGPASGATAMPEIVGGPGAIRPAYPEAEALAGVGGTVLLRFVVGEDGEVSEVEVVRGVTPALDEAAAEAVRRLRFRPGRQNGAPVRVRVSLPIRFRADAQGEG